MKNCLLIILLLLLGACTSTKSKYFTYVSQEFVNDRHPIFLPLDDSYDLYVRQVCRPRPVNNFYASRDPNDGSPVVRYNCDEAPPCIDKEKIEISYLLYSATKNIVVYLSTIPTYPKLNGELTGLYDMPLYKVDNFINIWNLNTFLVGEIRKDKFQFIKKNMQKEWTFLMSPCHQFITITNINNIKDPVDSSVAFPIRFYRRKSWSMGIDSLFSDTTIVNNKHVVFLKNRGIYFSQGKKANRISPPFPLFEFERAVNPEQTKHWLYFMPFRMQSDIKKNICPPECL